MLPIRPNTVEGWFRSAVPVLLLLGLGLVVWRTVARRWLRVVLVAVPTVAFLAYALLPVVVDETVEESVAAGARRERGGELVGIDHRATGKAALYRLPDGDEVLRLEELDMQNGPDLFVYLVPRAGQRSPDGGVNLGRLKGNRGNQQYELPERAEPDDYEGVLIWCRAFATAFAAAPLRA